MKCFALTLAAVCLFAGTAAFAKDEKPDYLNDKDKYSCEDEDLTAYMKALYNDSGPSLFRMEVLYAKDGKELSRTTDAVKCGVTIVHARGKIAGTVSYTYEDGHALIAFKPGRSKK